MDVVLIVRGALVSPVFAMLSEKLLSNDLLNYAREGDVLAKLKKCDRMLKKISAVLEDADEKPVNICFRWVVAVVVDILQVV